MNVGVLKETQQENWVKKQVVNILNKFGHWYTAVPASRFSRIGIPDFICCLYGVFVAIETKDDAFMHRSKVAISRGKNVGKVTSVGGPTTMQRICMSRIRESGGLTFLIDRHNVQGLDKLLEHIEGMQDLYPELVQDVHSQLLKYSDAFGLLYTLEPEA